MNPSFYIATTMSWPEAEDVHHFRLLLIQGIPLIHDTLDVTINNDDQYIVITDAQ